MIKVPFNHTDKLAEICANLHREKVNFTCYLVNNEWIIELKD